MRHVIKTAYSREFEKRLRELRAQLHEDLGNGCAMDFAAYRQIVGRMQGIDDALAISESVDKDMSGEN